MNKEMLKGTIDILILSIIRDQENYGYEISRIIKQRTANEFVIQEATMYTALKRLEAKAYIEGYYGSVSDGRQRKYFRLTTNGAMYFNELLNDWDKTVNLVAKFI